MSDPRLATQGQAPQSAPAWCPQCGRDVPVMEALVYHGIVYHPACVFPEREPRGEQPGT